MRCRTASSRLRRGAVQPCPCGSYSSAPPPPWQPRCPEAPAVPEWPQGRKRRPLARARQRAQCLAAHPVAHRARGRPHQVLRDSFRCANRSSLCVVAFPLGSWWGPASAGQRLRSLQLHGCAALSRAARAALAPPLPLPDPESAPRAIPFAPAPLFFNGPRADPRCRRAGSLRRRVGGIFTTMCLRVLTLKGYPLVVVTPVGRGGGGTIS
jgi:hypothetical protein